MVRVNFADIEDSPQLPRGKYHFAITDGEVKETKADSKHPGNDYWSLETTVQDGEQEGRKQYLSVMLPPYEVFTLAAILRATIGQHEFTEEQLESGDFDVELDDLMGLEYVASVRPQKNNPEFNEVRSFKPFDPEDWADADMLP
jgi:hypothetical protein